MKIHIDLPWGGVFHFEKEKMDFELSALALFIIPVVGLMAFLFK